MNKVVIITGASSGIGKAAALRLAEIGYDVLAGVRRTKDADDWKNVPRVTPLLIDVAKEQSIVDACKEVSHIIGKAQEVHLVNNAGIAVAGPVEGVSLSRWREQFEVNVFGLVRVTQEFLPHIRRTKGRVVNISSVSGLATSPYLGPYSASKFAVEAISDALRREMRQFGVKVVVVEPGPIATPIWEKNLAKKDMLVADLSKEMQEVYGQQLAKFQKGVELSAKSAAPVNKVSDVIEKAISAKSPRIRYVVGTKGLSTQMAVFGIAPDFVVDYLVAKSFGKKR
jgi:NAD(P)-dependent dehydrogenase (short-subunit alcohol dehydrogenase family)